MSSDSDDPDVIAVRLLQAELEECKRLGITPNWSKLGYAESCVSSLSGIVFIVKFQVGNSEAKTGFRILETNCWTNRQL
jgi:hypothetical protein